MPIEAIAAALHGLPLVEAHLLLRDGSAATLPRA